MRTHRCAMRVGAALGPPRQQAGNAGPPWRFWERDEAAFERDGLGRLPLLRGKASRKRYFVLASQQTPRLPDAFAAPQGVLYACYKPSLKPRAPKGWRIMSASGGHYSPRPLPLLVVQQPRAPGS